MVRDRPATRVIAPVALEVDRRGDCAARCTDVVLFGPEPHRRCDVSGDAGQHLCVRSAADGERHQSGRVVSKRTSIRNQPGCRVRRIPGPGNVQKTVRTERCGSTGTRRVPFAHGAEASNASASLDGNERVNRIARCEHGRRRPEPAVLRAAAHHEDRRLDLECLCCACSVEREVRAVERELNVVARAEPQLGVVNEPDPVGVVCAEYQCAASDNAAVPERA